MFLLKTSNITELHGGPDSRSLSRPAQICKTTFRRSFWRRGRWSSRWRQLWSRWPRSCRWWTMRGGRRSGTRRSLRGWRAWPYWRCRPGHGACGRHSVLLSYLACNRDCWS